MKKKTKLFSLLGLTLLFSVGLIGCGSKKPEEKPGGEGGDNPPAVETQINVTAEGNKTTLLIGETVQMSADVEGVKWSSTDAEVATVSSAGLVTAVKVGSTKIRAAKDGYKTGSVSITVERATNNYALVDGKTTRLELEDGTFTNNAGSWGYPQYGIAPNHDGGETPIEDTDSASGGMSLGYIDASTKITMKFTSPAAGKVEMTLGAAYATPVDLGRNFTLTINTDEIDLEGAVVPGSESGSYYDWAEVDLGEANVIEGENVLVFECIGSGANLDYVDMKFTAGGTAHVTPKIVVTPTEMNLTVEETAQINSEIEGLSYASSNAEVASVSNTGLVTAVKAGSATITVTKEGYKKAEVSVKVKAKPVEGEIVLEAEDAILPEETSIQMEAGDENTSGGQSLGYFSAGQTFQLKYTSAEAKKVNLILVAASAALKSDWSGFDVMTLNDEVMSLKLNGTAISLGETTLPEGPNWVKSWMEIDLGEIDLIAGDNVFEFEALVQGPNIDCLKLRGAGEVTPPVVEEKIIKTDPVDLTNAFYLEAEDAELAGGAKVEDNAGAHGGKAVGYMAKGASITINFKASKAGKAQLVLLGGSANADWSQYPNVTYYDQELEPTTSIKVNGADVSLTKKGFLAADGAAMTQVDLGEIDVALENTLVVTALAQSANFDAFALLADGITFELIVPEVPAFAITSAQIANENGKPVITLTGTSAFATAEMFVADVQSYSTWASYTYAAPVTLDEAGNWTLKFDVSLAKDSKDNAVPAGQYLIRVFFNGADAVNLLPYEGFAPVEEFVIDNVGYSIAAVDTWWNVKTVMLNVADKAAPAKTVTSVKVEAKDDKVYFVIEGTCENVTADMFTMDFQRYNNGWGTTKVTPAVTINDGEFRVEVELSALGLVVGGQYIVHFKLASESGDGNLASYTGFAATQAVLGETQYSTIEISPWGSALIFLQLDAVA